MIIQNKKIIYSSLIFLFFITLVLCYIIFSFKKNNKIKITFLDVGQGDSILIEEGSNQVLIDGGRSGRVLLEKLGENMPFWDREIEAIIITHPDTDHYGGLISVLDNYEVKNVIKTDATKEGKEWKVFEEKVSSENVESIRSIHGMSIIFSSGAKLQTVYPFNNVENSKDSNKNSVVMRLDFGENSFLFTGDIPSETESVLVDSGVDINVDILKIAHHGSKNSSSDKFLDSITPNDAIISVGEKNFYKHPHKEVLDKLKNRLIRIWRTDEDGDIVYECKSINENCLVFSK